MRGHLIALILTAAAGTTSCATPGPLGDPILPTDRMIEKHCPPGKINLSRQEIRRKRVEFGIAVKRNEAVLKCNKWWHETVIRNYNAAVSR